MNMTNQQLVIEIEELNDFELVETAEQVSTADMGCLSCS